MSGVRTVDITGADQQVAAVVYARYFGYALRETSGTDPVSVTVHEGTDATGDILDLVELAASGWAQAWYGERGIDAVGGVFVDVSGAGSVEGSVRVIGGVS